MPLSLVHVSDIHFGSGESHGRLNDQTGLNVRFEDFARAFARVVDFALQNNADLFLFTGDAYRTPAPEPVYQQVFAAQLKRLSDAGIPTVLLVGNHDLLLKSTGSHSLSVFQTLAVPNVTTVDRPVLLSLSTKSGPVQLIGLPYITRHHLMSQEKYGSLSPAALERIMQEHAREILQNFYAELNPSIPAIAAAHIMLDGARAGSEQELMIGYSSSFALEMFVDPRLDYVALGHVHKHQVLRAASPTIVYAGSLERVDFGEAGEDKGFVHAQIERGKASFVFHSIEPRPFVTVDADLVAREDPTGMLIREVQKHIKPGCVLRLRYRLTQEELPKLDEAAVRREAATALSVRLQPTIVAPQRDFRMPGLTEAAATRPLAALETYLDRFCPERKEPLLERARLLAEKLSAEEDLSPE